MKPAIANLDEAPDNWAARSEYWITKSNPELSHNQKIMRRLNVPLILSGHGVKLRIDRKTLLVQDGFTHYPQERAEYRFFPRDRRLPSRIVILDSDGAITFDALEWLSQQGISLIQINWQGEISVAGGAACYAADAEIVEAQQALQNTHHGFLFASHLIILKLEASIKTLRTSFPASEKVEVSIAELQERIDSLKIKPPKTVKDLLAREAVSAGAYFRCWQAHPIQWKGIGKKPIPADWHYIGARRTIFHKSPQFAHHPVNSILNYCYAVLTAQVRGIIVAAGFNPMIGYIHINKIKQKQNLVSDLMEPLRPVIDAKILAFIQNEVFSPDDFTINNAGVCKLNPQFAKAVVKLVQDIPEIEIVAMNNLRKLLALHPAAINRATKNTLNNKVRLIGQRE